VAENDTLGQNQVRTRPEEGGLVPNETGSLSAGSTLTTRDCELISFWAFGFAKWPPDWEYGRHLTNKDLVAETTGCVAEHST
jgi:hypothetical protein